MKHPSLTVIGLDAATFDVLDPLLDRGDLPNLAKIFERGSRGVLQSVTHPLTPHAWATIATGVNAGRHGIWDFTERVGDGYQLRLVNGSARRAPAIWDRLQASGRSSGLVNIPFTWPAPSVEGFAVAGFDAAARDDGMTHPAGLLDELRARLGELVLDHRFPIGRDGRVDLELVRRGARQKVDLSLWLLERFEPELFFVVFMAADHVQHVGWSEWERAASESAVAETYRVLDEAVGRIVEAVGDESDLVVLSDHGAGALEGVVNLNAWLAAEGYLEWAGGEAAVGRRAFGRLFELRKRLPEGLRTSVKQRLPGLRERAYDLSEYDVIEWERTRAFAYGTFGNIVLNVRGRERLGIVEPGEEYEQVREALAESLTALRGPAGERLVARVHRREDLFYGPELERIPDLVVEFDRYAWLGKGNLRSRATSLWDRVELEQATDVSYVGSHRREGVIAFAGPSFTPGTALTGELADVAPTLLYVLGEIIPGDLDGRVLEEVVQPELLAERPPEYGEAADLQLAERRDYAAGDRAEVEERLRSLGYLE